MIDKNKNLRRTAVVLLAAGTLASAAVAAPGITTHAGPPVRIGQGEAHTIVRSDAAGKITAIGVVMTAPALEGLPKAGTDGQNLFPYHLAMPAKGPRTAVDHVVVDWEAAGHPPPGVYDVPHFDFHFYLVSREEVMKVSFASPDDSAAPGQQPPAELMPAGYVLPPGTAVPQMGVHAINPEAPEFKKQPFTATFIYGFHNQKLTFIEPMASLAFLKSKPSFSNPIARPAAYAKSGVYPGAYRIAFDPKRQVYEVLLEDLR